MNGQGDGTGEVQKDATESPDTPSGSELDVEKAATEPGYHSMGGQDASELQPAG